jgi:hypothetical protein
LSFSVIIDVKLKMLAIDAKTALELVAVVIFSLFSSAYSHSQFQAVMTTRKEKKREFPMLGPEAIALCGRAWDPQGDEEEVFTEGFNQKITRQVWHFLSIM